MTSHVKFKNFLRERKNSYKLKFYFESVPGIFFSKILMLFVNNLKFKPHKPWF